MGALLTKKDKTGPGDLIDLSSWNSCRAHELKIYLHFSKEGNPGVLMKLDLVKNFLDAYGQPGVLAKASLEKKVYFCPLETNQMD